MASIGNQIREEWHCLKEDPPGKRFSNHRERMSRHSPVIAVGLALIGITFVAAGVVMLVMPGPGLLAIVAGFALLCGLSRKLAGLMDRAEPPIRRWGHAAHEAWKRQSTPVKAVLVAALVAIGAALAYTGYALFVR